MKNSIKKYWIIVFISIIGFSFVSCDLLNPEQKSPFEGRWGVLNGILWIFYDNNFTYVDGTNPDNFGTPRGAKGTFTYTTTHITFYSSQIRISDGSAFSWREIEDTDNLNLPYFGNEVPIPYYISTSQFFTFFNTLNQGGFQKIN